MMLDFGLRGGALKGVLDALESVAPMLWRAPPLRPRWREV